jgi:hypothetical protein
MATVEGKYGFSRLPLDLARWMLAEGVGQPGSRATILALFTVLNRFD